MKFWPLYFRLLTYLIVSSLIACNAPKEPEALIVKPMTELRTNTGQRVRIYSIENFYTVGSYNGKRYLYDSLNRLKRIRYENSTGLYQLDTYHHTPAGQVATIDRWFSSVYRNQIYSPTVKPFGTLIYPAYAERATFAYDAKGNLTDLNYVTDTTGRGNYMPLYSYKISYNDQGTPLRTVQTASNVTVDREYVVVDSNIVQMTQTASFIARVGPFSFDVDNETRTYSFSRRQRIFYGVILYDFDDIDFFSRDDFVRGDGYVIDDRGLLTRYLFPEGRTDYSYEVY